MGRESCLGMVITTDKSSEDGSRLLPASISKVALVLWSIAMFVALMDPGSAIANTETGTAQLAEFLSMSSSVMMVTESSKSSSEWAGALTCKDERAALTSDSEPWMMIGKSSAGMSG